VIAVVYEVCLAPVQKDTLLRLLRSSRADRPTAIVAHLLWCEGETAQLIALWESRDALDRSLATAGLLAVTEILAMLDAQAAPRIVEGRGVRLAATQSRTPDGRPELGRGSAVRTPEPDAARCIAASARKWRAILPTPQCPHRAT
jgi:hypothetical protein